MLLGDYLYAHGLVRVAELGDVAVVADLAELLSLCAQLRAEAGPGDGVADGVSGRRRARFSAAATRARRRPGRAARRRRPGALAELAVRRPAPTRSSGRSPFTPSALAVRIPPR